MQIHQINFRLKGKKRIGRGGKRGNYSGRGMKGQKARAGRKIRPALRDFILKIPKLRGIKNVRINKNIFVINIDKINQSFLSGEKVNLKSLKEKKLLKIPKGTKKLSVKILGRGNLDKSLVFSKDLIFSQKVLEQIKKTNSKIE